MISKNKKAGGKYLSIWWFFVVVIVAVGIIIGTLMFFGKDIDMRMVEADVLNARIIGCLVSQGEINQEFVNEQFDIFEECSLNKGILNARGDYFIKIYLNDVEKAFYGANFEKSCNIQSLVKAEFFPRCIDNEFYVDNGDEQIKMRVITGSNYYKV